MNRRRAITIAAAMLFTLPTPQFAFAQQAEAPTAPPHGLFLLRVDYGGEEAQRSNRSLVR